MQNRPERSINTQRSEGNNANVTSAIGMEETRGHLRARRHSLFTQTVIWLTGLVCTAFLLATFVQAWSNSYLLQKVQDAQLALQQKQSQHTHLQQLGDHYKEPAVIESEARQQLGYVRPGEQSVIITSTDAKPEQTVVQSKATGQLDQGYWQAWWHIFFSN